MRTANDYRNGQMQTRRCMPLRHSITGWYVITTTKARRKNAHKPHRFCAISAYRSVTKTIHHKENQLSSSSARARDYTVAVLINYITGRRGEWQRTSAVLRRLQSGAENIWVYHV